MSNKDVAAKYGLPKNTWSTWIKNQDELLDSLEKGSNIKQQNWEQITLKWWTRLFSIGS